MKKIKIIANYLPQFHETAENNQWWGSGYTDWVAVKKASPVFEGQIQPRIPYGNNYYDLSQKDALKWQVDLASKYGIYGFGIYHYWFDSNTNLLSRPAEVLLKNDDLNIKFMFIWDNATWKRTWSNVKGYANDWVQSNDENDGTSGVLAELIYGNQDDWKKHFDYLLSFFLDSRYIKIDNKPVFCFFNQYNDSNMVNKMVAYWNQLAINEGFSGIYVIGRYDGNDESRMDYEYLYEPSYHAFQYHSIWDKMKTKVKSLFMKSNKPFLYDYDEVWESIISFAKKNGDRKIFYGGVCAYDDTPRRGVDAKIILNSTPEKFGDYLRKLIDISLQQEKEFIFLTAWNEWGEGAYLEPDKENGFRYLEAVKSVVDSF